MLAEAAYVEELLSVHPARTGTHGAGEPRAVARREGVKEVGKSFVLGSHKKEMQRTILVTRHKSLVQWLIFLLFVGPQVQLCWMGLQSCARLFCTLFFAALVLILLPSCLMGRSI